MTWLTPLTGAILAAAVIPPLLVLYFLKLRRRPQTISCTLLWQQAIEDLRANAPFQKLRASILLFLQLLILIALALALMQPQLTAGQREGGKTVILIDSSASMAAVNSPDGQTRLELAKQSARDRIELLHGGGLFGGLPGEVMVISFADHAETRTPFTDSKRAAHEAIAGIEQTHGGTSIEQALKLARAHTTNVNPEQARPIAEPAALEIFSDGRIEDMKGLVLKETDRNYHQVGEESADNLGIVTISADRPYDQPTNVQVFAAIANYNLEAVSTDVQLSVDGVARGILTREIEPAIIEEENNELIPGRTQVVFRPFEAPQDAVIELAVLREDDLSADNVASIVIPPPRRLEVALVNPNSWVLQTALEQQPLQTFDQISTDQYQTLVREGGLEQYDVVIFDNHTPETLPDGRYIFFGAPPPIDGLNEFGTGQKSQVLAAEEEHPLLRFVNLDQLFVGELHAIAPADDIEVLVEGLRSPLVVSISRSPMQILYITFNPLDSNWPFLRSFVTFLYNAVEYLGNLDEAVAARGLTPGDAITTRLPASATDIEIQLPNAQREPLTTTDSTTVSWGPVRLAGMYEISWRQPDQEQRQSKLFAVNMINEAEGELRPRGRLSFSVDDVEGESINDAFQTPLWPWAILFGLMVMIAEWWIYHRKTYV